MPHICYIVILFLFCMFDFQSGGLVFRLSLEAVQKCTAFLGESVNLTVTL